MTPYYEDDSVTIYHGDCREIIPNLTGVELVVTSPPYNIARPNDTNAPAVTTTERKWQRLQNGYGVHADDMPHGEYVAWHKEVVGACWETLTESGAMFWNHKPRVGGPVVKLPLELIPDDVFVRQIIIWDRGSGTNRTTSYFVPAHEWIMLLAKPAFRLKPGKPDDVWRLPPVADKYHPASFPIGIPERAINSTGAQLVLDPFMGSGTTLRAAKDLGRKAIGIEIEERYCQVAVERLAQGVLSL